MLATNKQYVLGGFCSSAFLTFRRWEALSEFGSVPGSSSFSSWGYMNMSVCNLQTFLFQESISDKRELTSSCLTTSSGSGNTIRYKIKSYWVAKIMIRSLRRKIAGFLCESYVYISCILVNILVAATVWRRKGFAYVFNVNNFCYSISCKIAILWVSAEKSH